MTLRNDKAEAVADVDSLTIAGESQGRFRVYRLCLCPQCGGRGKWLSPESTPTSSKTERCDECRGEGRVRQWVAECRDAPSLGVALVTLGREGEFEDCPIGILDTEGEVGQKWLVKPWMPSPRNKSDAAKVLASRQKGENDA